MGGVTTGDGKFLGRAGAVAFREWIEQRFRGIPPDQYPESSDRIGSNKENPPASIQDSANARDTIRIHSFVSLTHLMQ